MHGDLMKKKVIVYWDYICPFCYIGKLRIDRLQEEFNVEVEWRGLEIHPETPKEGQTLKEMGINPHYIEMVRENIHKMAKELNLDLIPPPKVSNSKMALHLAEFVKEKGRFHDYHKEVFKAYWQDEKDIGNPDILFNIIEKIGLEAKDAKKYIEEERGKQKMVEYLKEARKNGIDGVPTFIIGFEIVEGAQPYEVFKRIMV